MDKQTRDIEDLMNRIKKMHSSENWSAQNEEGIKSSFNQDAHSEKEETKSTRKGNPHFDSTRINAEKETLMIKIYRDIESVEKSVLETEENLCVTLQKLEEVINKMMNRETDISIINAEADDLEAELNKEMEDLKNANSELQKILEK